MIYFGKNLRWPPPNYSKVNVRVFLTLKTDKREEIIVDLLFFFTALADYATNFIVLVLLGREDINVLQVGYSLIWAELRSMSQ